MENLFISGNATRTKAAYGAAFGLLLGVGIAAVVQTYQWEGSVAWVSHSFQVLSKLSEVSQRARELALNERDLRDLARPEALVPAREQPFVSFAPNQTSWNRIGQILSDVARLSADNAAEAANCRQLQALVNGRQLQWNAADQDRMNALIATMQSNERTLLDVRIARAHQIAAFARRLFEFACALSFLLTILAMWRTKIENRRRAAEEKELARREFHYRSVVESAGDLIFRTDLQGRFLFCNHTALTILQLTEQEVIGRSYLKLIRMDRRKRLERFYMRQFARLAQNSYQEFPVLDGHGRERWLGQNVQLIVEDGRVTGFQGIAREITERMRSENELQKSRAFVERVAETTPGLLYVYDLEAQRKVYCNREALTILGCEPGQVLRSSADARRVYHPDDLPAMRSHFESLRYAHDGEIRRIEYRVRHANGNWVWLASRDTPFERGPNRQVKLIVGIAQDVTARKEALEKIAQQANFDQLTGLSNNKHFATQLRRALAREAVAGRTVSVCVFRIHKLREINWRHGHGAGDEVLRTIGDFLRSELRPADISGRLGSDEFGHILPDTTGPEAQRIAERLQSCLCQIQFTGATITGPFTVNVTSAVASSQPGMEARDLLEAADLALFQASGAATVHLSN